MPQYICEGILWSVLFYSLCSSFLSSTANKITKIDLNIHQVYRKNKLASFLPTMYIIATNPGCVYEQEEEYTTKPLLMP